MGCIGLTKYKAVRKEEGSCIRWTKNNQNKIRRVGKRLAGPLRVSTVSSGQNVQKLRCRRSGNLESGTYKNERININL